MKAMLAVVILLVAAPQVRAGDEERFKKLEARLAALEARLQADEARKAAAAALRDVKARVAAVRVVELRKAGWAAAKNVQPRQGGDRVEVMLKLAAAGNKKAMKYLADLRKKIDKVLGARGQAVFRLQGVQAGKVFVFGKTQAELAKRKEMVAKLDALRAELGVQMQRLKELQAQEEQRAKAKR